MLPRYHSLTCQAPTQGMTREAVWFPRMARGRHRLASWAALSVVAASLFTASGCGRVEEQAPRSNEDEELPLEDLPAVPPEITGAPAIEPTAAPHGSCEAACLDVFLPESTGFAPAARAALGPLRPLDGARGWWVSAAPGREHSALICVENEAPEVECPWVMPLEATVVWDTGSELVRASLFAAEGLLEITLHRTGTDERCACLPFDLRARAP